MTWLNALANRLRSEDEREEHSHESWIHTRWAFWSGNVLLILSSTGLEWTRLYRFEDHLPGHHAGGVIGYLIGQFGMQWFGFNGSCLIFIAFMMVAVSWVFQFSWVHLAEAIGAQVDHYLELRREKRARDEDIALGLAAAKERDEVIHSVKIDPENEYVAPAVTLKITKEVEPPAPAPKSERVARERQKPLFNDLPDSKLPQVDLLDASKAKIDTVSMETLEVTSRLIEKKLKDFGVEVHVVEASPGPVITRYEIEPATGVKGSQVVNLAKDLARSLSLVSIRVVETIPGKNYMALELPNAKRQTIQLSEILGSEIYNEGKSLLTLGLGKDIVGNPVVADLAKMPHVLVAGTTGSGKSVGINAMILSLLYKAEARDVRLLMIDPKMLEMSVYEGIPHLLAPVVTDMRQAANGLNWCVFEMERRYKLMSKLGVRNLAGYNQKIDQAKDRSELIPNPFSLTPDEPEPLDRLPLIVVVIDELADLMMVVGKKIEELIARLAQKARAAGIHLILATQRPSVDVITGLIKANIPTRMAFQVSSKIDSRTILDQMGAESLLGMGDMLYLPSGSGMPIRVHGAFVSDEEVHRVVNYLKSQGPPNYVEGVLEGGTVEGEPDGPDLFGNTGGEKDPLYDQAVEIVLKNRKASISLVQRHLKIGYNRAARLVEDMEHAGLVSSMSTNGQREILVPTRDD
jgi:S-DNA-T family DNA segregation ATPase FtsK/SpoIIIE